MNSLNVKSYTLQNRSSDSSSAPCSDESSQSKKPTNSKNTPTPLVNGNPLPAPRQNSTVKPSDIFVNNRRNSCVMNKQRNSGRTSGMSRSSSAENLNHRGGNKSITSTRKAKQRKFLLWEYILLNIVIADFFFCVMMPFITFHQIKIFRAFQNNTACKILGFGTLLNLFSSSFFLSWMAVHRSQKLTRRTTTVSNTGLNSRRSIVFASQGGEKLKRAISRGVNFGQIGDHDCRYGKAFLVWFLACLFATQGWLFRECFTTYELEFRNNEPGMTHKGYPSWSNESKIQFDNLIADIQIPQIRSVLEAHMVERKVNWCDWTWERLPNSDRFNWHIIGDNVLYFTRLTGFLLPSIIITISYTRVALNIYEHQKKQKHDPMASARNSSTSAQSNKHKMSRAVNLIATCILSFCICWLPNQISHASGRFGYPFSPHIHSMTICILSLHVIINPIIYAFSTPAFQQKFIQQCGCLTDAIKNRASRSRSSSNSFSSSGVIGPEALITLNVSAK